MTTYLITYSIPSRKGRQTVTTQAPNVWTAYKWAAMNYGRDAVIHKIEVQR